MEKQYVSSKISEEQLVSLTEGNYMIFAGTGAGKTYFIKNTMKYFAIENNKRVLVLFPRDAIKEQTKKDLGQVGEIETYSDIAYKHYIQVMNYQSLMNRIKEDEDYLDKFDYIVCDEAHYFVNDSWNNKTQDELEAILNSKTTKIYMTATYKAFVKLFESRNIKYETLYKQYGIDFNLHSMSKNIRNIYTTTSRDRYLAFIQQRENKVLSIHSTIQSAYESTLILKDSAFICSESRKDYSKHIDKDTLEYLNKNKKFDKRILCATSVIESGVDIIDSQLDLIGLDGYFTEETILQGIGRKRFTTDEDVLDILILEPNRKSIGTRIGILEKNLEDVEKIRTKGFEAFLEGRKDKIEKANFIRIENDGRLTLDYTKIESMKSELQWLYNIYKSSITDYVRDVHGAVQSQVINLDKLDLELEIFEKFVGKKLFKKYDKDVETHIGEEEYGLQEQFKEALKNEFGLRANNGSKETSLGIKTINAFFEENNINYRVENFSKSTRINGKKKELTYWELIEIM